jgi:peptidoglycan/LPS O-acetylase OafA/YrhL
VVWARRARKVEPPALSGFEKPTSQKRDVGQPPLELSAALYTRGMPNKLSENGRIATLDGWRGIAIALVLMEHAGFEYFPGQVWTSMGGTGVDIFFVLSGYLITGRMLAEREETSTINLKAFYIRRAFRILPLLFCYLAVLLALSAFLPMDSKPSEFAGALFFFRNYQDAAHVSGVYTSHFWSLSIEEHFFFWPLLLLCFGNRRAAWIAGVGAFACAAWRVIDRTFPDGPISRFLPGATQGLRSLRTDVRLDGLLLGSVLAIVLMDPRVRDFILRNFPKEAPLVLGVVMMMLNHPWAKGYGTLAYYSLLTLIIASTVIVEEGLVYKMLNSRFLVGLGAISYSLYVWQELFLLHPGNSSPLGPLGRFPLNLCGTFLVASLSYYFLEKPLMKRGRRMADAWKRPAQRDQVRA